MRNLLQVWIDHGSPQGIRIIGNGRMHSTILQHRQPPNDFDVISLPVSIDFPDICPGQFLDFPDIQDQGIEGVFRVFQHQSTQGCFISCALPLPLDHFMLVVVLPPLNPLPTHNKRLRDFPGFDLLWHGFQW